MATNKDVTNAQDIVETSVNWISANLVGDICLREALLEILHDPQNPNYLPKDGKQLYQRMRIFQQNYGDKLKRVIYSNQWKVICPPSGESNSDDWDITIIKVVIQYENVLPPPNGGWEQQFPHQNDQSKAANVWRAKNIRNELKHSTVKEISDTNKFNGIMDRAEDVLKQLGYSKMDVFQDLKTCHIESYTKQSLKLLKDTISDMEYEMAGLKKKEENNTNELALLKTKFDQLDTAMRALISRTNETDTATVGEINNLISTVSTHRQEIDQIHLKLKRLHDGQCDNGESIKKMKTDVDELKKTKEKTITTEDIKLCFQMQRKQIIADYSQKTVSGPIREGRKTARAMKNREDIFVDLSIIQQDTSERENQKLEYPEFYKYTIQEISARKENITIEELIQDKNYYVLLEGIAGIGKTELVETLTLKWAKDEIFNGKNGMPRVDLLLPIICRELNISNISPSDTNETILKKLYPKVFKNISLEDIEEKGFSVMFIIDGLDELMSVEQIEQPNKVENPHQNRILHFIRDIMIKKNGLLNNQYTCVAGRPTVVNSIQKILKKTGMAIRRVQVCGFNEESVNEYIQKHCSEISVQERVKEEIKSSDYLSAMSQVPVYLWVICNIYKDDLHVPSPRTTTELMIYACLVFIRNHLLDSDSEVKWLSLQNLCEREDVVKLILAVAEISFWSLTKGKVIFENQEIKQFKCDVDELERKLGFIIKIRNGENRDVYQFNHLVLQEFFAGIHIFLSKDFCPITDGLCQPSSSNGDIRYVKLNGFDNRTKPSILKIFLERSYKEVESLYLENIDVCYVIIVGLEGMSASPNELMRLFVQKLKARSEKTDEDINDSPLMKKFHELFIRNIRHHSYLRYHKDYLQCCFENGCELPKEVIDVLRGSRLDGQFSLGNQKFDLKVCLHFLEKLLVHGKYIGEMCNTIRSVIKEVKDSDLKNDGEQINIILDRGKGDVHFNFTKRFGFSER